METWLAWAAGFVDGEGCIRTIDCTHKGRFTTQRWYSITIDVSQVKREPLDKFVELFGGKVLCHRDEYGPAHVWRAYGSRALNTLEKILPYLVVKKRQAELCIEFQRTKRTHVGGRISQEVHIRRKAIHYELLMLNARRKKPVDAERLSEATPCESRDDATVRSHGNKNRESVEETATPVVQ